MNYQQLTDAQRYQIEAYLKAKYTITEIASELGVYKSSISRELKRNSKKRGYNAVYAIMLDKERKRESFKHHVFNIDMEQYINKKLTNFQWSPKQIKGRCDLEGMPMVSVERIYQYIYEDQAAEGIMYLHLRTTRRWRKALYQL